jgi:hypothetical protein
MDRPTRRRDVVGRTVPPAPWREHHAAGTISG